MTNFSKKKRSKILEFNCVYSRDAISIKKFFKRNEKHPCINYMDVFNKLYKNDLFNDEPSDIIVSAFIQNKIEEVFSKLEETSSIFYAVSSLDPEMLCNLKSKIQSIYPHRMHFNLYVPKKDKDHVKISGFRFKEIKYFIVK